MIDDSGMVSLDTLAPFAKGIAAGALCETPPIQVDPNEDQFNAIWIGRAEIMLFNKPGRTAPGMNRLTDFLAAHALIGTIGTDAMIQDFANIATVLNGLVLYRQTTKAFSEIVDMLSNSRKGEIVLPDGATDEDKRLAAEAARYLGKSRGIQLECLHSWVPGQSESLQAFIIKTSTVIIGVQDIRSSEDGVMVDILIDSAKHNCHHPQFLPKDLAVVVYDDPIATEE